MHWRDLLESHDLDRHSLWARLFGLDERHADELSELEARTLMSVAPEFVGEAIGAPVGLTAVATGPTTVDLRWPAAVSSATGYQVMRADAYGGLTHVGTVSTDSALAFVDTTAPSNTEVSYHIIAFNEDAQSAPSDAAIATTPLDVPADFRAMIVSDDAIRLEWRGTDATATGYVIYRSLEGDAWANVARVEGVAECSFIDTTVSSDKLYSYRIQAVAGTCASDASAPVTPQHPDPASATGAVEVTSRYSNEAVVTLTGDATTINVTATDATLRIMAGGVLVSEIDMPSALFIYDRGGTNAIAIDASVSVRTTITSVGGGMTSISSSASDVSVWIDSTDSFGGSGSVHIIGSLAGGVSMDAGDALPNPTDAGATRDANASLWGSGPTVEDVNQGSVGDCYFLATLGALALSDPRYIADRAVDLGDGTYVVEFNEGADPVYVRVSDDLPTTNGTYYRFARPGESGSVWVPILEKAFAYFRTGANTYSSISGGWMSTVFTAFGVASSSVWVSSTSEESLFSFVSTALDSGRGVTFGTGVSSPTLVGGHAYTVTSVRRDSNGVAIYTVRNPWGVSGTSAEDSAGYAELSYAQMRSNFTAGVRAA